MTRPDFREEIERYDVNIFLESHLHEGQLDTVESIPGYEMASVERDYKELFRRQWGGVVAVYRVELGLRKEIALTSTDILVLSASWGTVVGAYVLPEGSDWGLFADISPYDKLTELMTVMGNDAKPVVILGDLNARTGTCSTHPLHTRASEDTHSPSPRGNSLLRVCRSEGYAIFNGLPHLGPSSAWFTSHRAAGHAVVDYAIGNRASLEMLQSLDVRPWRRDWSDHSEIVVSVRIVEEACRGIRDAQGGRVKRRRVVLPEDTELDTLLVKAWKSRLRPDEELAALYGKAYCMTSEVQVYVDGSCLNNGAREAQAGAGVFFGQGSRRNRAVRTPDSQTNNRAEVFAVLQALLETDVHKSLVINSDSEYAINMLTVWGAGKAAMGWKVVNGDVLRDIAWLLKQRPATVTFRKVRAHSGNMHNDAADALAKEGALGPAAPPYEVLDQGAWSRLRCQCGPCVGSSDVLAECKVVVDLGERRSGTKRGRETSSDVEDSLVAAKRKSRERQAEIRQELFNTSGEGEFWRFLGRLKGSKPGSCGDVTAQALMEVFMDRMNFTVPTPMVFDAARLGLNRAVAATLPAQTPDVSPLQSFSRPFTEDEVEVVKVKLKARMGSAKGRDGISYRDIFYMDNECLLELCNRCIELCDSPATWVRTRLVGLCKKGKPKEVPESYRTIGLESCVLKFMTMLVHERLVEWAGSRNLIPPSQNGFRQGRRTNDNVFVLRCAVEKAKAEGLPLYAAFVDLSNAFPSTEHATLWLKLRSSGAGGKVFDWLRALYRDMAYTVSHDGGESGEFKADMGILIGDTCSPILWALYMADLPDYIGTHDGDIQLGNVRVTSLEQADDVVLLATSPRALQEKLDGMLRWCKINFMEVNRTKSVVMILGRKPRIRTAQFSLGGGQSPLMVVDAQMYLGFTLSSKRQGLLRMHYDVKREKARQVGRGICGVEQLIGTLPPAMAIKLYMALVDPHLIQGCEVMPDVNATALALLTDVQKAFLRRSLALSKHSIVSVLFSETGVDPLEFRRLDLVLGYWLYIVACPPSRYVHQALQEAISLDFRGKRSWVSEVRAAVAREARELVFPAHPELASEDAVRGLREGLRATLGACLTLRTNNSRRLYLLHDRLEPGEKGKEWRLVPSLLRHYLQVNNPNHRKALTKLLLADHTYGDEVLSRRSPPVPLTDWLCRLCQQAVETPAHIWMDCSDHVLLGLRADLVAKLLRVYQEEEVELLLLSADATAQLIYIVRHRPTVSVVAQFAYDVQERLCAIDLGNLHTHTHYQFNAVSEGEGKSELSQAFSKVFHNNSKIDIWAILPGLIPPLQSLKWLLASERDPELKAARATMDRIGNELLQMSKAEAQKSEGKKGGSTKSRDLLSLLMRANTATDIPEHQRMRDTNVISQISTFLVAGHETTSTGSTWMLYALSKALRVQKKLREELSAFPRDDPTMEELNAFPYLDAVVRETLRLHPPVTTVMRVAMEDDVLPLGTPFTDMRGKVYDSIPMKKGQSILIPIIHINTDEAVWGEDSKEFRPERWDSLPEETQSIPGVWGNILTFNGGPRACIGWRFSVVEMKAIIFTLIRAFEFELAVPDEDIERRANLVQRPFLRSDPGAGCTMPLKVKMYQQP